MKFIFTLLLVLWFCVGRASLAWALLPAEVLVIANDQVAESLELARYYLEKRAIPLENLLIITTSKEESCSRNVYNHTIAQPVRNFLKNKKGRKIRAFVTLLGVPLKVEPPKLNAIEQQQLRQFKAEQAALALSLDTGADDKSDAKVSLQQQLDLVNRKIRILNKIDSAAAVDSELTLVLKDDYALNAWQPNPFFIGYQHLRLDQTQAEVLLGSRLDAPTLAIAKRMIDDSLAAERNGLHGTAYFDAKAPASNKKKLKAYALYDQALHLAAKSLEKRKLMPVVVDEKKNLFQAGEAPNAALYCGWYSLSKYVDAFDWQPGAIGYHIASGECTTLRAGSGQGWCKRMLEDGVAATLGPVAEPYLQAFPPPDQFFELLLKGQESLVEVYFHSLRYLSWQMILIGDPLYRPFHH